MLCGACCVVPKKSPRSRKLILLINRPLVGFKGGFIKHSATLDVGAGVVGHNDTAVSSVNSAEIRFVLRSPLSLDDELMAEYSLSLVITEQIPDC
jgi:hypothetical protein